MTYWREVCAGVHCGRGFKHLHHGTPSPPSDRPQDQRGHHRVARRQLVDRPGAPEHPRCPWRCDDRHVRPSQDTCAQPCPRPQIRVRAGRWPPTDNSQIRPGAPTVVDLVAAAFTGLAGAYAIGRRDIGDVDG